jgi:putative toxin-antitoxin system antitoxin component (TIGR02293 family)
VKTQPERAGSGLSRRRPAVKTKKGEVDESVLGLAVDVLGGREAAHEWLGKPALGLQFKTPIELMRSSQGKEEVRRLLERMLHGVYT